MRLTASIALFLVLMTKSWPLTADAQGEPCTFVGTTSEGEPLFICDDDEWLTSPLCDPRIAGDCTGNEIPYPGPAAGRPPVPYRGGQPGPAAGPPPVGAAGASPRGAAGPWPHNAAGGAPTALGQPRAKGR
jgi:hypothetical protein